MAYVEETKLLRFVTLTAALTLSATMASTQEDVTREEKDPVVEYAPGSTGPITAPLATIDRQAEDLGRRLETTLEPQGPQAGAFSGIDFDTLRDRALTDPRVRDLMGIDPSLDPNAHGQSEARYDGTTVFLLASFSMPKPSLRQIMEEADRYGVPVVFRGFVNNSVYDTEEALRETFGSLDAATGFSIDPTLFTRFKVEAVPVLVATVDEIDVCETPGCEADPVPPHDRVGGNVPLEFALKLIADAGDVAAAKAKRLLEVE